MPEPVPDRGDFVWLQPDQTKGHEQGNVRPWLVLTPKAFNDKRGLLIACRVTRATGPYAAQIPIPGECGIEGAVLGDQIRTLAWRQRLFNERPVPAGRATPALLSQVQEVLAALLFEPQDLPPTASA